MSVPGTFERTAPSAPSLAGGGTAVNVWACAALAAALVAVAGSLALSMGMGLKACPLCLYQRTFVMGAAAVLGLGLLVGSRSASLLALPLAAGGLAVGAFHEYLELTGRLECPAGVLGLGTAPQQALVAQALLVALLPGAVLSAPGGVPRRGLAAAGALVLGGLMAWGAVASAPPMRLPTEPYKEALDICRPPYRPR